MSSEITNIFTDALKYTVTAAIVFGTKGAAVTALPKILRDTFQRNAPNPFQSAHQDVGHEVNTGG